MKSNGLFRHLRDKQQHAFLRALTFEVSIKVDKGNIFPLLLPLDARVLVSLCAEHAGEHGV